jgi:hypothetical protein
MLLLLPLLAATTTLELSGGILLESGYRPGMRVGAVWPLVEGTRDTTTGTPSTHTLVAGPDLGSYIIPNYQWTTLPGAILGYRRTGHRGLRLELDTGVAAGLHQYLIPTYVIENGELTAIPMAGRMEIAPNVRLGIGRAPTTKHPWGLVLRPGVYFTRIHTGPWAPVAVGEVAALWSL